MDTLQLLLDMASGSEHYTATTHAVIPTGIAAYVYFQEPYYALAVVLGVVAGIFITPDLDFAEAKIVHPIHKALTFMPDAAIARYIARRLPRSYKRSRRWLQRFSIYRFIWYPYGWLLPHRSRWSHFPVISTMLRIFYVGLWLSPLIFLEIIPLETMIAHNFYILLWAIGLTISDLLHWAMDGFPI